MSSRSRTFFARLRQRIASARAACWRFVHDEPRRNAPRPLRLLRLERRRVLSADFTLTASGLLLDGFDNAGGDSLTISQAGDDYQFTVDSGEWESGDGAPPPDGVTVDGATLTIDRDVLQGRPDGIAVVGDDASPLDVRFGEADFSRLSGPLSISGATSIGQQPLALLTAPADGLRLASGPVGATVGSITIVGNFQVIANGPITDAPGSVINVTGDATFVSRPFPLEADFNDDGVVNMGDLDILSDNFGAIGATKAEGDANGDGVVDLADNDILGSEFGLSSEGGITLADTAGDRFEVTGTVTFDAADGGDRFAVNVGAAGQTSFGEVNAFGSQVSIVENASTELGDIDADQLSLTAAGPITAAAGAEILVAGDATLTSEGETFFADFNEDGVVDAADEAIWAANFGLGPDATKADGDANLDGVVDAADFSVWRMEEGSVDAGGGIEITDAARFEVSGLATLVARDGDDRYDVTVDLDVTSSARFGSLTVVGANALIEEVDSTLIDTVDVDSLELTSNGEITDKANASIRVAGDATLRAVIVETGQPITIGDNPGDTTLFGSLTVWGSVVQVQEDTESGDASPGTELGQVIAESLSLSSDGPITQTEAARVSSLAMFDAGSNDITLTEDENEFGSLDLTGGDVAVREVLLGGPDATPGTALANVDVASLSIVSDGPITDTAGAEIRVDGNASFESLLFTPQNDVVVLDGDVVDFGSLSLIANGDARINETSSTVLANVSAFGLYLVSDGTITDEPGGQVLIGVADFDAGANNVTLDGNNVDLGMLSVKAADVVVDELNGVTLGDVAVDNLTLTSDGNITGGTDGAVNVAMAAVFDAGLADVTLEGDLTNPVDFGTLSVTAGLAQITETSGTNLVSVDADTFVLTSGGSIDDEPGGSINVAAIAAFDAGANHITLDGDDVNFGQLRVSGADVLVREASGTVLDAASATSFDLASMGPITDDDGAFIDVDGAALLNAGSNAITLDAATVPMMGAVTGEVNFGTLSLIGGDVLVNETSGTNLGDVTAASLAIASDGPIVDEPGAVISVSGAATFFAKDSAITLDNASVNFGTLGVKGTNVLVREASGTALSGVDAATFGLASMGPITDEDAAVIDVDGAALFDAGVDAITLDSPSVNFGTLGLVGSDVLVNEASGTEFSGIDADNLQISSQGPITDLDTAAMRIRGEATFDATTGITLADGPTDDNSLVIDGLAMFEIDATPDGESPRQINLGVDDEGGFVPAGAVFDAGSLSLIAPGGDIRIGEDSGTVLGSFSRAMALFIESEGAITDDDTADVVASRFELSADSGAADVVLGDGGATFGQDAPALFDEAEYVALEARNVSVQADSSVNLRTAGGVDPVFAGTYYLTATGDITQVGAGGVAPAALTANRIALASDGALLLSAATPTSADGLPNLQLKAGAPIDYRTSVADNADVSDRFSDRVPTTGETDFAPVEVSIDSPDGTRPDANVVVRTDAEGRAEGLEDLVEPAGGVTPAMIAERNQTVDPGDLYSLVVQVEGSVVVGAVDDATATIVDDGVARGLAVSDGDGSPGNAYLDTTGDLLFTGAGRFEETFAADGDREVEVVSMAGGLLTAIAGGTLGIDTEDPEQQSAVKRTTKLRSATGVVTALAEEGSSGADGEVGPRALLDAPSESVNAATTGLVTAGNDFQQRVTLAVGSRGEDNLLIEFEWADVANVRDESVAGPETPIHDSFDLAEVNGSRAKADVTQTPIERIEDPGTQLTNLEDGPADDAVAYDSLGDAFRVFTATHNYDRSFVPANPARDTLPTTVRIYNDPAINLFDQGASEEGPRDLNSTFFTLAPRIITTPPPGFFLLTELDTPTQYETTEVSIAREVTTPTAQRTQLEDSQSAATTEAEVIFFGRWENDDWARDIPGEAWPQTWDNADGDFVQEIRDLVDGGPFSEGSYRILVESAGREVQSEEWIKGDLTDEEVDAAFDEAWLEGLPIGPEANGLDPIDVTPGDGLPLEGAEDLFPLDTPGESAPAIDDSGASMWRDGRESSRASAIAALETRGEGAASGGLIAAGAAVAVWRSRLERTGAFRLDEDGVAFTRVERQRRGRRTAE